MADLAFGILAPSSTTSWARNFNPNGSSILGRVAIKKGQPEATSNLGGGMSTTTGLPFDMETQSFGKLEANDKNKSKVVEASQRAEPEAEKIANERARANVEAEKAKSSDRLRSAAKERSNASEVALKLAKEAIANLETDLEESKKEKEIADIEISKAFQAGKDDALENYVEEILPPEVQQSMVGRADYELFQEGVHGAVKVLYTSYEIGMHLRTARREIEQRDAHIQSLQASAEKAENELKKANTSETHSASQVNPIVVEQVNLQILDHVIADRETMSMFATESAKARPYEKGFHDGQKIGIEKMKEKLAKEVYRCKNRGFKHG
ncbi:uncharacterized protein LOC114273894 [Camellia sinensis]|uniref:uncharacterized protein LOC114273894 n=1 Tax=Camellia sinensis TaxID=4442 RepID=UPI001035D017|nr:uncharacterized protein LOC114273894 [Camellia sinensis]